MTSIAEVLKNFVVQANTDNLKTSHFPKEWEDFSVRVSFGMGAQARVPWIGLLIDETRSVSRGINPVYLYFRDLETLVLVYGVGEYGDDNESWPAEIISNSSTVQAHFDQKVPRYGDSFVFKAYRVEIEGDNAKLTYIDSGKEASDIDLQSDLETLTNYFKKVLGVLGPNAETAKSTVGSSGLFYMEKQLEDFLILNWDNTQLGTKYDLIIEDGELLSQQYRTDIGPIDILAKDKKTGSYVVIELKKDQTSDNTVGQVARYMGWIKKTMGDKNVTGVIIAGQYDKKLDFALQAVPNVEVFLYEVHFDLREFSRD